MTVSICFFIALPILLYASYRWRKYHPWDSKKTLLENMVIDTFDNRSNKERFVYLFISLFISLFLVIVFKGGALTSPESGWDVSTLMGIGGFLLAGFLLGIVIRSRNKASAAKRRRAKHRPET